MGTHEAFVMMLQLRVVIQRKLPELESLLETLPDWRTHPQYSIRELAMGVIFISFSSEGRETMLIILPKKEISPKM